MVSAALSLLLPPQVLHGAGFVLVSPLCAVSRSTLHVQRRSWLCGAGVMKHCVHQPLAQVGWVPLSLAPAGVH